VLVAAGLDEVAASWRERSKDIQHSLELAREELINLERRDVNLLETFGGAIHDLIFGRGLTLLIAIIAGGLLWFVMRALREQMSRRRIKSGNKDYAARLRLLLYGYHLLSILLVAMAVLTVFYIRGDLLLLSLAIIAHVMLALGAWRFLPQYIHEGRLLFNMGAAREGERVVYNGLPFRITSLNLYSLLQNPELAGSVRLPLSAIGELISRPAGNEAWFPSRVDEYLLLPDGAFAQVLEQTVERVPLKVVGSIVDYSSADFIQLNVRNLSREGFGVVVTFGIDYQHQSISLDQVPRRLREGLQTAFSRSDYGDDLKNLVVEFKSAAASSLDYLIYATMQGSSAASYYAISRFIQQTCVDICNQEGWVIPFTQVTIHQAEAE
jgi:small-conductance mechanosensitive channel